MFSFASPQHPLSLATQSHRTPTFSPHTPSPLQSNRNANLMPPPPPQQQQPGQSEHFAASSPLAASSFSFSSQYSSKSPPSYGIENDNDAIILSPSPMAATTTPNFLTAAIAPDIRPIQVKPQHPQFHFQARIRSQSPQTSLAQRTQQAATRRRTQLLDRVQERRQRDTDSRFDEVADQMLRIDFMRQRRAWEEALQRGGPPPELALAEEEERRDWEMEMDRDRDWREEGGEEEGLSPPTEDREIEELLAFLNDDEGVAAARPFDVANGERLTRETALLSHSQARFQSSASMPQLQGYGDGEDHHHPNQGPRLFSDGSIHEDDDYDALFMELDATLSLSTDPLPDHQQQQQQQQAETTTTLSMSAWPGSEQPTAAGRVSAAAASGGGDGGRGDSNSMDIS